MGLDIPKNDREKIVAALEELSAKRRAETGVTCDHANAVRVVVDAAAYFRRNAPTKTETTAHALARRFVDAAVSMLGHRFLDGSAPEVPEIYLCFDTQAHMPPQRERVVLRRNPSATPEAIERARRDPTRQKVVVNNRVFRADERPLTPDEVAALDVHTPFPFPRAMNSSAGKEKVWALLEAAVLHVAAEDCRADRRYRLVVDGPAAGPGAVCTLERGPEMGPEMVVRVVRSDREIQFGEADQKCAYISTHLPSPCPDAPTVIVTIDTDMLAQQVVCAPQRHPENDNTLIMFPPHASAHGAGPRWVDCYGFPLLGDRGSTVGLLLTLCGSDYTTSLRGVGLDPVRAIEAAGGPMALDPCFSVTDAGAGVIHPGGLVDAIVKAYSGKKPAQVLCFDDSAGEFYISKAAALAACPGKDVRKRHRTTADLHAQLRESMWLVAYWSLTCLDKSPAAPPALDGSASLFPTHRPLHQFLREGAKGSPAPFPYPV